MIKALDLHTKLKILHTSFGIAIGAIAAAQSSRDSFEPLSIGSRNGRTDYLLSASTRFLHTNRLGNFLETYALVKGRTRFPLSVDGGLMFPATYTVRFLFGRSQCRWRKIFGLVAPVSASGSIQKILGRKFLARQALHIHK